MDKKIMQFRLITGEDVIAEYTGFQPDTGYHEYINAVQLIVIPSKQNPQEQTYAFAPFPSFSKPKSTLKVSINSASVVFYTEIEEDFLSQYNMIFGGILAPTASIFTG